MQRAKSLVSGNRAVSGCDKKLAGAGAGGRGAGNGGRSGSHRNRFEFTFVCKGLTSHSTHNRSFVDDFYRPDHDQTNSVKALKETS